MNVMKAAQFADHGSYDYPGRRFDGNFLLVGDEIVPLPHDPQQAAAWLGGALDDLTPVVAYGRNASPNTLHSRMNKYPMQGMTGDERSFVPVLKGMIENHDVVWHGSPGQTANFFSEIVAAPGQAAEAYVLYLRPDQLAQLHAVETSTYGEQIVKVNLAENVTTAAIAYVPHDSSVLLDDKGQMVAVSGIGRSRQNLAEMNERQALEYTLSHDEVIAVTGTPYLEEYKEITSSGTPEHRRVLKQLIERALFAEGMAAPYHYPAAGVTYARVDFDTLPRGLYGDIPRQPPQVQLVEQTLASARPSTEEIAAKIAAIRKKRPDATERDLHRRAHDLLDVVANVRRHETYIGSERHGADLRAYAKPNPLYHRNNSDNSPLAV